MLAYFYGRVSTDHQDNSIEVQLTKARAYAAARGLTIPDPHVFTDSDTSGSIPFRQRSGATLLLNTIALNRRALSLLPAPSSTPPPVHIITSKIDRMGRNVIDVAQTFEHFGSLGITVHITDQGGDSFTNNSPLGQFFINILAAFAQLERGMIRARAADVLAHQRAKGILLNGTAPYGWNAVPIPGATTKSGKQQYRLEPHPAEQAQLRHMHQLRRSGLSYARIATALNTARIPTKTGAGLWQSGNVANVLTSTYTQELLSNSNQTKAA